MTIKRALSPLIISFVLLACSPQEEKGDQQPMEGPASFTMVPGPYDPPIPTNMAACEGVVVSTRPIKSCLNKNGDEVDLARCSDNAETVISRSPSSIVSTPIANGFKEEGCAEGSAIFEKTFECNIGHYLNGESCDPVGVGFYSSEENTRTACPSNSSTLGETSASLDDCLANAGYYKDLSGLILPVEPGHMSPALDNLKYECSAGTYSDETGAASCKVCTNTVANANSIIYSDTDRALTSNSCAISSFECNVNYKKVGGACVPYIVKLISTQGARSFLTIRSDGVIQGAGGNNNGQLGYTPTSSAQLTPVTSLHFVGLKQGSIGLYHTCFVLGNGDAFCVGRNEGRYGNGASTYSSTPVKIAQFQNAKEFAVNPETTCAIMSDNTLKCSGNDAEGQFGDGSYGDMVATATTIAAWNGIKSISLGHRYMCGIMADNTVQCSGYNNKGQLGDGVVDPTTSSRRVTPFAVPEFNGAKAIATGTDHTCAIMADDTVRCTGNNAYGQLGIDGITIATTPVSVPGFGKVKSLALGSGYTCAIIEDGTVKCTGLNSQYQLARENGVGYPPNTPVVIPGIEGAKQIAADNNTVCVIVSDDSVKCWGGNSLGDAGNGTSSVVKTPEIIPYL